MIAHGGVPGAIAESLVGLLVIAVFVAAWVRERRAGGRRSDPGPAPLREEDEPPS